MKADGHPSPTGRALVPGCVHLLLFGAYLMLMFDR
jgi:hypothetical protein